MGGVSVDSRPFYRGAIMKFQPGQSGNPVGRPKGSYGGRRLALEWLDKLIATKKGKKKVMDALWKELDERPLQFFKTIIMPFDEVVLAAIK